MEQGDEPDHRAGRGKTERKRGDRASTGRRAVHPVRPRGPTDGRPGYRTDVRFRVRRRAGGDVHLGARRRVQRGGEDGAEASTRGYRIRGWCRPAKSDARGTRGVVESVSKMTYASGSLIKHFFHSERKTSKTKRGRARFGASGVAGARCSIRVSPVFCAGADLYVHAPGASRESRGVEIGCATCYTSPRL